VFLSDSCISWFLQVVICRVRVDPSWPTALTCWVPEFVEGDPEGSGVAEEPEWECEREDQQCDQRLFAGEKFGEKECEEEDDHPQPGDAVVEVDRAEEETGPAMEGAAAVGTAVVHGEGAAEDLAASAGRAAEPRGSGDEACGMYQTAGQRSRLVCHAIMVGGSGGLH
jgi:hypothetical protein